MNWQTCQKLGRFAAFAGVVAATGACGDVDGVGEVQVVLEQAAADALFQVVTAGLTDEAPGPAVRIAQDEVSFLNVTITSIGLLSRCEDGSEGDECGRRWDRLVLDGFNLEVDLMNLPVEGGDVEPLAVGEIPVGIYHRVRLLISEATVAFKVDITVGDVTFLAYDETNPETVYTVEIREGRTAGVLADIELEVTDDNQQDVGLLFDPEETFRSVVATSSGRVLMPPIFRARMRHRHRHQYHNEG